MKKYDRIIIDADICMKLDRIRKVPAALYKTIKGIASIAYIHAYVYEEEIVIKIEQLERLIAEGYVEIIYPDKVIKDPVTQVLYKDTLGKLLEELVGVKNPVAPRGEHYGEVYSLAMAKTLGIPVFMSDEGALQQAVKRVLNTGINDITIARLKDIIKWMHENNDEGFSRADARAIYIGNSDEKFIDSNKKWFNENWPAEKQ